MNICADYVKHGLALVPIPLGTKGPVLPGWNLPENAVTTTDAAANITGNVGLLHAYCSQPTASIDIDDLKLTQALLANEQIDIMGLLQADDAVQISSGRPNRAKLLYRLPAGSLPLQTIKIVDPKTGATVIEFRCASKSGRTVQDVLPPSIHPETGKEYAWAGLGHWSQLPEMPEVILKYWDRRIKKADSLQSAHEIIASEIEMPQLKQETIQYLRSALLHMRSDGRDHWVKIGMALYQLRETGRGLWLEWSVTSEKV